MIPKAFDCLIKAMMPWLPSLEGSSEDGTAGCEHNIYESRVGWGQYQPCGKRSISVGVVHYHTPILNIGAETEPSDLNDQTASSAGIGLSMADVQPKEKRGHWQGTSPSTIMRSPDLQHTTAFHGPWVKLIMTRLLATVRLRYRMPNALSATSCQ